MNFYLLKLAANWTQTLRIFEYIDDTYRIEEGLYSLSTRSFLFAESAPSSDNGIELCKQDKQTD